MRDSVKKMERFNRSFSTLYLLLALCIMIFASPALGVTTNRVWSSPETGFAIDGYDPVAYFTQAQPRKGVSDHEYVWSGVAWRFVNEGNMDAFRRNPDIYAPQLGGYALDGLLHHVLLPPNPLEWALYDKRLYLFNSSRAKKNFEKSRIENLRRARENWEVLSKTFAE